MTDFKKFICLACGYVYDEAVGDPDGGLPAGTRFDAIPDDWQCPLCGVRKTDFEPYEDNQTDTVITAVFDDRKKGVVIVGAGLAGWSVVDAIRTLDKDIPITLICSDEGDRYHKPMLSVAISGGKTKSDLVRVSAVQSAMDNHVRLLADTFVTDINTDTQTLHTTKGSVGYDDLVLAIGATPVYPPSISREVAWHVNNLSRFTGLQNRLLDNANQPKHIAIIGGGMIGVELGEDLTKSGHHVSLIDINAYPLSSLLPSVAGERILSAIQKLGITWLGKHGIQSVQPTKDGYEVSLLDYQTKQAKSISVDEIVVATGLGVDKRLPVRAGVHFEQAGIIVDPKTLQTTVPNIYALGDCISIDGIACRYVAPHRSQATAIAHEILNLPHTGYQHKPPMIRLKNKSITVTATGLPYGGGDWQVVSDDESGLLLEMHQDGTIMAKATLK